MLRQHKLGEADYILTLLTRENGLVRAVAKGIRRPRSRFGASLELFAHVDLQLYPGRSLDTVTQVHSIAAYSGDLAADYGRYTTACAVIETAERLAGEERAPVPELHRLTVGALREVARGTRDRELILVSYLLRAMDIAGWAPTLTLCARCGGDGGERRDGTPALRAFHVAAGGAVCVHCRPPGSAIPAPGVLDLMVALHRGDWAFADTASDRVRSQAAGLAAAHLQWHVGRQLRSLPLIERHAPHSRVQPGRNEEVDGAGTAAG
ncbi:DNA repair protein RecO [Tsukamurella soli]|uniref:DNA repair protein RecO n=1 Tax=Tsukamurella soli TaxID=644556 RepID=A0ABP8JDE0_9ACTN